MDKEELIEWLKDNLRIRTQMPFSQYDDGSFEIYLEVCVGKDDWHTISMDYVSTN